MIVEKYINRKTHKWCYLYLCISAVLLSVEW